ncbi:MAG: MBL fold metallo-hydrolase [Myxococcota bacterium]|nr:MBL fold metallo-hydrolase [Myxococcota bacterium]
MPIIIFLFGSRSKCTQSIWAFFLQTKPTGRWDHQQQQGAKRIANRENIMRSFLKPGLIIGGLAFLLSLGCEAVDAPDLDSSDEIGLEGRVASTGHTSDNLVPDGRLTTGQYLQSADGSHRLSLQSDGNLVLRRLSDSKALWASGTNGKSATRFYFQTDGNLVLRTSAGAAVWSSKTSGSGATKLHLHSAGSLVLYKNSTPVWAVNNSSIPADQCPNDPNKTEPGSCGCGVPEGTCQNKELKVAIFSVGSADSSLVFFPTGKIMMVDSATEGKFASTVLPFLKQHGIKHLDYYVETHPHPDHIGGRAALIANKIVDSKTLQWDWKTHDYGDQFSLEGTKWFITNAWDSGFHGSDANDNSLSYRIEYNGFVYSAAGDEGNRSQDRMLKDHPTLVPAHIQNTAHHMWGPVSKSFLVKTNPYLFVISCYSRPFSDFPADFRNAVTTLKGSGRLKEWASTGDVGHIAIRAANASTWGYKFCGSNNLCSNIDYIP